MLRRISVALAVIWLWASAVDALTSAFSYQSLTVDTTVGGVKIATATLLDPRSGQQATVCSGRLETAQIRFRYDGTGPTAAEGELLEIGDRIAIVGMLNVVQFRAIRTGGTSGVLKLTCER